MIKHLRPIIGKPKRLVSPFLGSGAIEIDTCCKGIPIYAADANRDVIRVWEQILQEPQKLADELNKIWPQNKTDVIKETYYEICAQATQPGDDSKQAAAFIYTQNFGFGGAVRTGFGGGSNYATYPSTLQRITEHYYLPNFQVSCQTWETTLSQTEPGDLAFLDPPYPGHEQSLYAQDPINWTQFYDTLDALPCRWVLTLILDEYATERLSDYPQISKEFNKSFIQSEAYAGKECPRMMETIVTNY